MRARETTPELSEEGKGRFQGGNKDESKNCNDECEDEGGRRREGMADIQVRVLGHIKVE